jgi:zinc transporter ZupT
VAASAIEGFRTLIRQQIELVKLELIEALSVRAKGIGMMAAAAALVFFAIGYLAATLAAVLDTFLPAWAANLLLAFILVAAAGVLVMMGKRTILNAPKTERTQEMLKEDAEWAKQQIAR